MGKFNRILLLALVCFASLLVLSACQLFGETGSLDGGYASAVVALGGADDYDDEATRDLEAAQIPLTRAPAIPNVIMPVASGRLVERNSKALIDHSNTVDGYVMVRWLANTNMQLRVQVVGPSETTYTYTIFPNESYEVFPLSDGNGSYTINVFEQVEGSRYALATGLTINVNMADEFAPFLRPNQFVNFDEDSKTVMKAAELVSRDDGFLDKIAAVYAFVMRHLSYDTAFANEVISGQHKGYVPVLDSVLDRGKGICFDYAALMTAMLRSQSIPTKLVIGYAGDVKHAWISVFSEETGWVDQVIFFDGKNWLFMDPTFASAASSASALQEFIGDGSIYNETHLY